MSDQNSDPARASLADATRRRLESEAAKNEAERAKLLLEGEEIRNRLQRRWYTVTHEKTLVGVIVAGALFATWAIGYLQPILTSKQEVARLENRKLELTSQIRVIENEQKARKLADENQAAREQLASLTATNERLKTSQALSDSHAKKLQAESEALARKFGELAKKHQITEKWRDTYATLAEQSIKEAESLRKVPAAVMQQAVSEPGRSDLPEPAAAPTGAGFEISGAIRYYGDERPVPNVAVQLIGPRTETGLTDGLGRYTFRNVPSARWRIVPGKLGGVSGAVTALDAVYVLEASVHSRDLDKAQRLACDVTGNGEVSPVDGAVILQFLSGLPTGFPAAQILGSSWVFMPKPARFAGQAVIEPLLSPHSPRVGEIDFDPLGEPVANQDFVAIALGDCSGSWEAGGPDAALQMLRQGDFYQHQQEWRLPIYLVGGKAFQALYFELHYDSQELKLTGCSLLGQAKKALHKVNGSTPGVVKVVLAGVEPIVNDSSLIAEVRFERGKAPSDQPRAQITNTIVQGEQD